MHIRDTTEEMREEMYIKNKAAILRVCALPERNRCQGWTALLSKGTEACLNINK